jgi:hypothetical protein
VAQIVLSAAETRFYDRLCEVVDELDMPLSHRQVQVLARVANQVARSVPQVPRPRREPSVPLGPVTVPPPPAVPTAGSCTPGCSEPSVGWRRYVKLGWQPRCVRHMSGANLGWRLMDAEIRASLGGAESGAVCPPGGLGGAEGTPGASGASAGVSAPSEGGAS